MNYPISHIHGIDEDEVKRLQSLGIRTTEHFLEEAKTTRGRQLLSAR